MRIDDAFVDYMAESSGAVQVELRDASGNGDPMVAMTAARRALFQIPHPEEEDDPLPSYASEVVMGASGPTFTFDIADAEAYDGLLDRVAQTLAGAVDAAGVNGVLAGPTE